MPAGQDLIFFDNSRDWQVVADVSTLAQPLPGDRFVPISPIDLGVSLLCDYIAVVATTEVGKPSWQFAGDIRQVYNFVPGGSSPVTSVLQSLPTRLFINKLQIVETNRISTDRFRLRYTPPFWFRSCAIRVYEYTGDTLNFVEDSLFNIGNALGAFSNQPESLIEAQLTIIEELITDKFAELRNRESSQVQLDDFRESQLNTRISQTNAGVYTLAEGLAAILPPEQGEALRRAVSNRLQLDLGFL
ncbi:hypothetical protein [Pleurocapsa sp. FMAR1]|uniref:hypothetical protein n=1 Tax=Pleurocapsa sp. FMAR1 TaxID=3040204 RepID=UPI0029C638A7|nr:hypothetical protein [Pleurocapsa sp. FMAR1]